MKTKISNYSLSVSGALAVILRGLVSSVCLVQVTAAPSPPASADQVLGRHFQAMGGREALAKVRTEQIKGTADERGREFDVEIQIQGPDQMLFVATMDNGLSMRMCLKSNGKGWRQEPGGLREFKAEAELNEIREMHQSFLGANVPALLRLMEDTAKMEVSRSEGKSVIIKMAGAPGKTTELEFDNDTGLLQGGTLGHWGDYRLVDGIKLPFTLRAKDDFSIRVKEIKLNVPIKEGTFDLPKDVSVLGGADAYRTRLSPPGQLTIVHRPPPARFGNRSRKSLPAYNPASTNPFQVDLRGADCQALDLKNRLADLLQADFDDGTRWPGELPAGFNPQKIMDTAKNPGLRVRELHRRGITGRGIGVAVIDQSLLVDHLEYADRLRLYEEVHNFQGEPFAAMHGPAVASLAVGKTVGVAPEADLYYIAETHGNFDSGKFEWDFTWLAKAIERIVEVNQGLPTDKKIRVISISVGWSAGQKGFAEANAAVAKARAAGIFVISTALETTHKLAFHGLGREPSQDPDNYQSYGLGSWWAKSFRDGQRRFPPGRRLLVPMDARGTASPTGPKEYVYYSSGGWSWSVPYLAGLYALACQVQPAVTPEQFWTEALKSGNTVQVKQGNDTLELGTIVNPVALIEKFQRSN